MIIVSAIESAEEAVKKYDPGFFVSIIDKGDRKLDNFANAPAENRVELFGDCQDAEGACASLLDLAERWKAQTGKKKPILVHCHRGVARSMAVAYILLCAIEEKSCEAAIAARLRAAAPHADPNIKLISAADTLMGRHDRMTEAILDLSPSCGAIDAPIVTLPVAA